MLFQIDIKLVFTVNLSADEFESNVILDRYKT